MFTVHITDHVGPAEFVLVSPVVALDLVLRAARAGLHWTASVSPAEGAPSALTLTMLRSLAELNARHEPTEADHLQHIAGAEDMAAAAALN